VLCDFEGATADDVKVLRGFVAYASNASTHHKLMLQPSQVHGYDGFFSRYTTELGAVARLVATGDPGAMYVPPRLSSRASRSSDSSSTIVLVRILHFTPAFEQLLSYGSPTYESSTSGVPRYPSKDI
jgi:hypothetical protein